LAPRIYLVHCSVRSLTRRPCWNCGQLFHASFGPW